MTKIELYIENDSPVKIVIDGKQTPIDAFFLTTSIPQREAGNFLAYGNSDAIGTMLFSFWRWAMKESEELAYVLEEVSKDIIEECNRCRGRTLKTEEGVFH